MKIVKTVISLLLIISTITSNKGFYPGSTNQQLLMITTKLINMNTGNSVILNTCLKNSFDVKYENIQRDLWMKLEKVRPNTNDLYKRTFWIDFFSNIKDEIKDATLGPQVCGVVLAANMKNDLDFNTAKVQNDIKNEMGLITKEVSRRVADRNKLFITSSVSTHRYAKIVDKNIFSKLNSRPSLK